MSHLGNKMRKPQPKYGWHGEDHLPSTPNRAFLHWNGEIPEREEIKKERLLGIRNLRRIVKRKGNAARVPDEHFALGVE